MPKKRNFLGGMQNYDADNGQYLPDLTNSKGEPIKGFKNFRKGDEDNDESFDTTNKKRMGKSKKPNIDTSTPKGRYQYNKQLATNTEPGKIVKYHPLLKKPGEDFYFSEETERAKMLNNGIAMGTKKHSSWERYTKDAGGKYRPSNYYVLIDIETGLTCGRVENYEDGLEKTNDKEWLDIVNNARNTFKTKHPNHFEE